MVQQPNQNQYLNVVDWQSAISDVLGAGTSIYTSKQNADALTSQANAQVTAAQLALEKAKLDADAARALAASAASGSVTASKGLSTGAIIGIVLGGVAVLGGVVYLAVRK